MEPILISFDQSAYKGYMNSVDTFINKVNRIINQVNQINGYQLTKDHLYDLLNRNGEMADEGIKKAVEYDLNNAKIRSSSVRDIAVKADREAYYKIIGAYSELADTYLHAIEIGEDCKVHRKKGIEEQIKNRYSHYIRTEKGKAIYEAQKRVVEGLNEILKLSKSYNSANVTSIYTVAFMERAVELVPQRYDDL